MKYAVLETNRKSKNQKQVKIVKYMFEMNLDIVGQKTSFWETNQAGLLPSCRVVINYLGMSTGMTPTVKVFKTYIIIVDRRVWLSI